MSAKFRGSRLHPGIPVSAAVSELVRSSAACPRLLALSPHELPTARRAVALAMPPFEARLQADGRYPIVSVLAAKRYGASAAFGLSAGVLAAGPVKPDYSAEPSPAFSPDPVG